MRSCLAVALAVCAALLIPAAVSAQSDVEGARRRMGQGEVLFEGANYEAALVEFDQAYTDLEGNSQRYLLLFNIGQCYERMFRYDRALAFYRRYLDEGGPEADGRADVEATIRALQGLLATLDITSNAPAAHVWVDGLEVGTAPGQVLVAGGLHRVELRADGFVPEMREVQAAARQTVAVAFDLHVASDYRGIHPAVFVTTAAVAGATLVVAVILGSIALSEKQTLAADGFPNTLEDQAHLQSIALPADVLFATGGTLAVAAVVLAFVTDWGGGPQHAPPPVAVAPLFGSDVIGLAVGGAL